MLQQQDIINAISPEGSTVDEIVSRVASLDTSSAVDANTQAQVPQIKSVQAAVLRTKVNIALSAAAMRGEVVRMPGKRFRRP